MILARFPRETHRLTRSREEKWVSVVDCTSAVRLNN